MGRFAVTHVPGLEQHAAAWLARAGASAILSAEGLALFTSPHQTPSFPWAANVFTVLEEGRAKDAQDWIAWLMKHTGWAARLERHADEPRTFRIMPMQRGTLTAVAPKLMSAMEDAIARATGWESYRARPDIELWAVAREDGMAVFMMRMTRKRREGPGENPAPGTLAPDLCGALAQMAGVTRGDIALDPFAGSGAIVRAMAARGAEVVCADRDAVAAHALAMLARTVPGVKASCCDAFEAAWEQGAFSAVVTDPPWGTFKPLDRPVKQYVAALAELCDHTLSQDGIAVLLWAREDALAAALKAKGFAVTRTDILLHGRKAAVWLAERRPATPQA